MPYRRKSVDKAQRAIVEALEAIGAVVTDLTGVGGGCPDILVGFRYENWLFEIKSDQKIAHYTKGKQLTEAQQIWHGRWPGQVAIVRTAAEALAVLGF